MNGILTCLCVFAIAVLGEKSENFICRRAEDDHDDYAATHSMGDFELTSKINELAAEAFLEAFKWVPLTTPENFSCDSLENSFDFKEKCFWVELPPEEIRYPAATRICASKGGFPANIYSERHFKQVMRHLRKTRKSFYHVYLGMHFDTETGKVTNYDGSTAKYTGWRLGDPVRIVADPVTMNRIAINVVPNDDTSSGMLTSAVVWPKTGVLCEVKA